MTVSSQKFGMLIGGIVPALVFGINGIINKLVVQTGLSLPLYFIAIGLGCVATGVVSYFLCADRRYTKTSALYACSTGCLWTVALMLSAYAIDVYKIPIGKLVPLYNMNTLVAVFLALWLFKEYKNVRLVPLISGSALIIIGGIIVTKA